MRRIALVMALLSALVTAPSSAQNASASGVDRVTFHVPRRAMQGVMQTLAIPARRSFAHSGTVVTSYDAARDAGVVSIDARADRVTASFVHSGATLASLPTSATVSIAMRAASHGAGRATLSGGGASVELAVGEYDGTVATGDVPLDAFLRIANADAASVTVDGRRVALSPSQLEVLRDLASRMLPASLAAAN